MAQGVRLLQPRRGYGAQPRGQFGLGAAAVDFNNPLNNGLAYLRTWDSFWGQFQFPTYSRTPQLAGIVPWQNDGGTWSFGPSGIGATGLTITGIQPTWAESLSGAAAGSAGYANQFQPSKTTGTILMFVTADFSPGDGAAHSAFTILDFATATQGCNILKWSDNNWYLGWTFTSGSFDGRVVVPATFNPHDTFVVGFTYNPSTTTGYVAGKIVGTNSTPAIPTLTGGAGTWGWFVNNPPSSGLGWSRATGTNPIYWHALWDRELNPDEMAYLQAMPYALFAPDSVAVYPKTGHLRTRSFIVG